MTWLCALHARQWYWVPFSFSRSVQSYLKSKKNRSPHSAHVCQCELVCVYVWTRKSARAPVCVRYHICRSLWASTCLCARIRGIFARNLFVCCCCHAFSSAIFRCFTSFPLVTYFQRILSAHSFFSLFFHSFSLRFSSPSHLFCSPFDSFLLRPLALLLPHRKRIPVAVLLHSLSLRCSSSSALRRLKSLATFGCLAKLVACKTSATITCSVVIPIALLLKLLLLQQ